VRKKGATDEMWIGAGASRRVAARRRGSTDYFSFV
jgi:hypothetical protein